MNYKIKHLKDFLDSNFDMLPKSLGVELVELGILNYSKLTPENYDYWWYEVSDKNKIDRKQYTFSWDDLVQTSKIELIKQFIKYHKEDENMYTLITAILNIESARFDGIDISSGKSEFERQIEFYYSNKKRKPIQMQLF